MPEVTILALLVGSIVGACGPQKPAAYLTTDSTPRSLTKSDSAKISGRADQNKGTIHAGEILGRPKLIHYVKPDYPKELRRKHVEGVVQIKATIGKDGVPKKIVLVKGPKELIPLAAAAFKRWRYGPVVINGTPVEVVADVQVPFSLSQ